MAGAILVEIIASQVASRFERPQDDQRLPAENTSAVLPFEVCAQQPADQLLAGGLTNYQGFTVWKRDFTQIVNPYDQVQTQLAVLVDNGVAARLGDVVPAPNRSALDRRALEQLLIGLEYSQMGEREAQERRALSEASYAESEKHYRVALAIQPSDSEVRWRLAGGMARLGPIRRREALDVLLQGLQWDPFNEELAIYTALRQIEFGRFREAMELLDNFDALPQGKSNE